jgi:uncharacterized membrane protein YfcA
MLAIVAFAGLMAGLLGVGGGIVLVPAFFFVFTGLGLGGEYVMQLCLGTSLAIFGVDELSGCSILRQLENTNTKNKLMVILKVSLCKETKHHGN